MSDALHRMTLEHLEELKAEVWKGDCVAFVGAGFSAAANLPGWEALLREAAEQVPADHRNRPTILHTLAKEEPSSRELEAVAQLIQDATGPAGFREAVSRALIVSDPLTNQYLRRRRLLKQVPFQGILTTNFDPLLPGHLPSPTGYRTLLRDTPGGPWSSRYWPGGPGPTVMQLHGSVGTDRLVFARRDYRHLLFGDPGYLTFLKSLFATRTVLFMGFSFRDAYIDLLRAELMSLVERPGEEAGDPPAFGYSIMTDVTEAEAEYYRVHEGLRVLWYEKTPDFSGLDDLLLQLAESTNPMMRLRRRMRCAKVLWLDPNPENNGVALQLMGEGSEAPMELVRSLEEAQARLTQVSWDVVLTHWGHRPGELSTAQCLLDWMHAEGVRCPVVVFSGPAFAKQNRVVALKWGAFELASSWTELFRAVDGVLPT